MDFATCKTCGSELKIDAATQAARCEFCDGPLVPRRRHGLFSDRKAMASIGIGTACAAAFLGLAPLLLPPQSMLYYLFFHHGWVPYVCVLLFFCAFWMLVLKLPTLNGEFAAFDLELLPQQHNQVIDAPTSRKILARINRLDRKQKSRMLVSRIRQALMRFNQLGTAEKLDDLLRYRADTDLSAMESSYAAPRFIIWAIPVLGFVGTVMGISTGVQHFSTLIQTASNLQGLRHSLKGVTYGLGQAFQTTMLALTLSLILMLIMSIVQHREDHLLAAIDEYCAENLLQKATLGYDQPTADDNRRLLQSIQKLLERLTEEQDAKTPVGATPGQASAAAPAAPAHTSGDKPVQAGG